MERNPLTARAVTQAEDYPWSSLWVRAHGSKEQRAILSPWPTSRPADWIKRVNAVLTPKERQAWRGSLERNRPFGDDDWMHKTITALGLEHTLRTEGRPKQQEREG